MLILLPPSEGKATPAEGDPVAPAAPAAEVYTGVLYDRLRLPELSVAARDRVLIASALWGAVRPGDSHLDVVT